ncbi:LOW QUALITY PROTEIN: hypothetical protein CVT25_007632 [Psilocybe cyanescens]|uniref:Uncharacterized protein n=1 Tax=Psilocybe cyanescens TaxID=93625 RepID=A0A409W8I4_PSICY|nr:LOW QUALITY PROTEIN: hypothetical protein CVT25_007632 [Psilocybe cyanescens]
MVAITNNVYTLVNRKSNGDTNVVLDIYQGRRANGTPSHIWAETDTQDIFNQQWLLKEVDGKPDVYTLRNLRTGTYLDLSNGSSANGTQVQGWSSAEGSAYASNQQWKITTDGTYYRLQNVSGKTYLDLLGNATTNGTKVHGWAKANVETQDWLLRRVSRTGTEIRAILAKNPYIGKDFKSYLQDGLYDFLSFTNSCLRYTYLLVVLPKTVRDSVYNGTGLRTTTWRPDIFDCDDFAFVSKGEVARWGNSFLGADGVAILWGVMFGTNGQSGHAYNWYLNKELDSIMFFEPQNGQESTNIGYNGFFAIF